MPEAWVLQPVVSPPWERAQIGYENPNQGRGVDLVRTEGEGASRSVADAGIDGSHDGSDGRVGQDHAGAASEPKPATDGVRASDPPGATTPLGWWAISGEAFLDALRRAHAGDDPDVLYAEHYANSHSEQVTEARDAARQRRGADARGGHRRHRLPQHLVAVERWRHVELHVDIRNPRPALAGSFPQWTPSRDWDAVFDG